jgi:hypothetical protein
MFKLIPNIQPRTGVENLHCSSSQTTDCQSAIYPSLALLDLRDCKLVCVKGGEMRSNELAHLRQEQSTDGNPS